MGGFKANAFTSQSNPQLDRPVRALEGQAKSPAAVRFSSTTAKHQQAILSSSSLTELIRKFKASLEELRSDRLITAASQYFLGNHQPRVKWWRDAQGHDHYSVYDPHTQRTHAFDTAHEVRAWLEKRYYQ